MRRRLQNTNGSAQRKCTISFYTEVGGIYQHVVQKVLQCTHRSAFTRCHSAASMFSRRRN